MAASSSTQSILRFLATFLAVYILAQFAMQWFFPEPPKAGENEVITLSMEDASLTDGHHPVLIVHNRTVAALNIADQCPEPPVGVEYRATPEAEWKAVSSTENVVPCAPVPAIASGGTANISLAPWKYSLFTEHGEYRLTVNTGVAEQLSQITFTLGEPGPFTKLFRMLVTQPLLNFLILIASLTPGYNLGAAIILFTIIIKLVLFLPTQHALEGQKKLQALQPKIAQLKEKYGEDPKKLNEETMKLWKQEKVNPFQSCLPMLLQFPILIGMFYVIRDGSHLELSRHLLYSWYTNLSWQFGTGFLGLDLLKPSMYIMPPLLVVLQFLQMKLSFAKAKKAQEKQPKKPLADQSAQDMQQQMMLYVLPVMIGVFAFQFPAAVSLYWGVSTVFGIVQQLVVNRRVG